MELQPQEVMTEDYFSNDEYDCASPDDISLPPLAETPESNMVPSDIEDGFCFSSHSVHISQYSHQCRAQSEHSGTGPGVVRQQRGSSLTENCPTPPASLHSSSRSVLQSHPNKTTFICRLLWSLVMRSTSNWETQEKKHHFSD